MKECNLELKLNEICEKGLVDLESAISRFGHGDCHDLTTSILELYKNVRYGVIFSEQTKTPIHSCILLNDTLTLDAYGINTVETTLNRYKHLTKINLSENAIFKEVTEFFFNEHSAIEEPEDILFEFQVVLDYIGLDLNQYYIKK
jgi:hypothetical protein